jgi:hypothetical protein
MSRKTILLSAPLGLGAVVLAWAALSARGPEASTPERTDRKAAAPRKAAAEEPAAPARESASYVAPARPTTPSSGGEYAVIEERIRLMESKLVLLETKRDELATANQDLERQIGEKNAELSARAMAEGRVQTWAFLLGLTGEQKQSLLDLCTQWHKSDAGRSPNRETWINRENELRSRLSVEQAAKLHDFVAQQSQSLWNHLGRTLGSMVGASKEDQTKFQQTLGAWQAPGAMLLPEGYGADWPGMMKEGTTRLQSVLTSDQMAKLNKMVVR